MALVLLRVVVAWYLAGKMCTPRCRKLCWGNRTRLELILLVLVVLLVGCNAACALPACLVCWLATSTHLLATAAGSLHHASLNPARHYRCRRLPTYLCTRMI